MPRIFSRFIQKIIFIWDFLIAWSHRGPYVSVQMSKKVLKSSFEKSFLLVPPEGQSDSELLMSDSISLFNH